MNLDHAPHLRTWLALFFLSMSLAVPQAAGALKENELSVPAAGMGAIVIQSTRFDISPELRSLQPLSTETLAPSELAPEVPNFILPKALRGSQSPAALSMLDLKAPFAEDLLQPSQANQMPSPLLSFDGISNLFNGWPPDTQGDIGQNHYIQWINMHFSVWQVNRQNNTATLVYGPVAGNTLFQGLGGPCETSNDGDPITLFDPFDNRWFMSQFALPYYPSGPFYQCVAVSATSNPLGSWYRYEYQMPLDKMNDYPKFGVWPNAYFMTMNQFNGGSLSWGGAGVAALERPAMLIGAPARMVYFDLFNVNQDFGGMLPADFDGMTLPPSGTPGIFSEWDDSSWIPGQVEDSLRIWQFIVDWAQPELATFGQNGQPNWIISTMPVDPNMCSMLRNCIPQPGTSNRLDAISDRLMHRLQYRNFGSYASLVGNHTVDVDGLDHAGVHWFELRKEALGGSWQMNQQGVYAPDANHRWMGSLAMDHVGDIALGYSLSSSSVYPSVRYTGRLASDPLGTMPQGEQTLITGTGSQTLSNRWGDYSMMGVDPVDDCTFWYTQEYVMTSGSNTWKTRIGSFKFPGCSIGPQGQLLGTITAQANGNPIENATLQATLSLTQTFFTQTNADGDYLIDAPVGIYTVTASAYGYYPFIDNGVEIISGTQTIRDYALQIAPTHIISGFVRDATTGWGLYAKVTPLISGADAVWSDPATGFYSLELVEGTSFSLLAEAYLPGYASQSIPIASLTQDITLNLDLQVEVITCSAPGYQAQVTPVFSNTFEATEGGLTTSGTTSWAWGTIESGPGTAHSGVKGWATNLQANYANNENGYVNLPPINLSAYPGQHPAITWWQYLNTESKYDYASIEVSKDNASTWQIVYGPLSGLIDSAWQQHSIFLDPSYAVSNLLIRFHLLTDVSITYPGWYLDDLEVGIGNCIPQPGGLVVGNVLDANTLEGLNNASIVNDVDGSAKSQPTPDDPNLADGFYWIFSPQGSHVFTATHTKAYQPDQEVVNIPLFETIGKDFLLQAGYLAADPQVLDVTLELGNTLTRTLLLDNQGGAAADFHLVEMSAGVLPNGPFEQPNFGVKSFKADLPDSQAAGTLPQPEIVPLPGGQVIQSWLPGGALSPWSVAFDWIDNSVWVSSPAASWSGNDQIYEFTPPGSATGRSFSHTIPHTAGPADLAFNWNTGMIWVMNVNTGIANCIYELDPDNGYTGESICPGGSSGFATSQRGLAYDPDTDTWFAGGWNDMMVHRFDSSGNILSSVNTGLAISGLAFNPDTQHLFAMINDNPTRVYVMDVPNSYALLGYFTVGSGFGAYAGSGIEFDCDGNLWGVDLGTDNVVQFESGESANLCQNDIPWISTQPISGTLTAGNSQAITVTFDASIPEVNQPGIYTMQFKIKEDTPYLVANLPVTMTVTATPLQGKLKGIVNSLGYCDLDPHPLQDAQVEFQSSLGEISTTQTNASGEYQRWLDETGSPFTVTVTAPDYLPIITSGVQVTAGVTTTLDLDLYWQKPCLQVEPMALEPTVKLGLSTTATLIVSNTGQAAAAFTWHETVIPPAGYVDNDWLSTTPISGSIDAISGSQLMTVTFDAGAASITSAGQYLAGLVLDSNDPQQPQITIPVTFTVQPLVYGVQIDPDMTLEGIPGQVISYTFALTNTSDGLTDYMSLSLGPHNWHTFPASISIGPLASGAMALVSFSVSIPESALPGDLDEVTIEAISQGDPTKKSSIKLSTTAIEPVADLELSLHSFSDPVVWAGQPLTYTAVITNHGSTMARNVVYVNVLSKKIYYLSSDPGCSLSDTVVVCQLNTMQVGEVRQVRISGAPLQLGLLMDQAAVTSDASDPDMGNNFVSLLSVVQGWINYLPLIIK